MDKETKQLLNKKLIKGKLYLGEPSLLYYFGEKCNGKGVILEIGSWKGKSTMLLTRGSMKNPNIRVYAVDTFEGTCEIPFKKQNTFREFKKNMKLAGINHLVKPLVGFSADIDNWTPKLIDNGWILFHDTSNNDVLKAVKEKIINSNNYSKIGFIGSIIFAKKSKSSKLEKLFLLYILFPLRVLIVDIWKNLPESIKELFRKKRNDGDEFFFLMLFLSPLLEKSSIKIFHRIAWIKD